MLRWEDAMPLADNPPDDADPTALTQAAVERAANASRDYVDGQIGILRERLRGIDRATELLSATVGAVPTDLQKAIGEILRLMDERDRRIEDHFDAIRRLRESESILNQTALQAALASSEKATAVSAASLDRTIEKNAQLADQAANSISARIFQVNEQVVRSQQQIAEILAKTQGTVEQKSDTRAGAGTLIAVGALVIGVLSFIMTIILTVTRL